MNKRNTELILFSIWTLCLGLVFNHAALGQDRFQEYFDEYSVEGSVTIYDLSKKKWIYTNKREAKRMTLPASTFKILNSLIILENNLVKNENEVVKWNGKEQTFFGTRIAAWNKDTDLKTAYKLSTVWFYVEMADRLGRDKYKKILRKSRYGNSNFSEEGTDFWNYGEFGVSPKNQIKFLRKLHKNKLPFSSSNLNTVKDLMISVKKDGYTIRDKTGWTKRNSEDIGWWVGYVEKSDNVYFFATRITKPTNKKNPGFSRARKEITKKILRELRILPKTDK